ncbi:MAG: substrate-binding domain-containing protein [Chloroflexota bacterium]|nr:substrate-binding domain-containing protein [Chloroflexota bacterium]
MNRHTIRWVAFVLSATLGAVACSGSASPSATGAAATTPGGAASPEQSAAPSASAAAQEKVRIAFVAGQIGITFYTGVECGAKQAAKDYNVDLNWNGSHNWDINEERPIIDADLATNPQGWVISPTDPDALISTITDLMSKGIPVVTIDAPMSKPAELQNIQSNHYQGGQAAAAAMIKLTGGKGKYLVLQLTPGLPDIGGRAKGFEDDMAKAGATLLPDVYPGTDQALAADAVTAAIGANPDLAGVYATHETAANGAASAIKAAGKQGAIKLVAFDSAPNQIADLKKGVYDALIAQAPFNMGYNSVKLVAQVIRKEVDPATVKHDAPTALLAITKDNVDSPETLPWIYPADLTACPSKPLGG